MYIKKKGYAIGATSRIDQEIQCLQYTQLFTLGPTN